jgi:hypothetical protein
VRFREKLRKRVAELKLNKTRASRDAGLPPSTISSYLAKPDSLPRLDIALRIARAIDVPLEWLADDEQDWPPPASSKRSLPDVPQVELTREVVRRYRLQALQIREQLERAEQQNWAQSAADLAGIPLGDEAPLELERALRLESTSRASIEMLLDYFEPSRAGRFLFPTDLPGPEVPWRDLTPAALSERAERLRETEAFSLFEKISLLRINHRLALGPTTTLNAERERLGRRALQLLKTEAQR